MNWNTGDSAALLPEPGGRAHEVLDVVAAGEDARLAGDQHRAHGRIGLRRR
jgi:hypothetical protein